MNRALVKNLDGVGQDIVARVYLDLLRDLLLLRARRGPLTQRVETEWAEMFDDLRRMLSPSRQAELELQIQTLLGADVAALRN